MQPETAEQLAYLTKRSKAQRRWFHARQPQPIGKVMGQLMLTRRYARGETNTEYERVWNEAVGENMAARSRPTGIRRGKLEVTVAHPALVQELTFDQGRIVRLLSEALPEAKIDGVKYRVGKIEKKSRQTPAT